MNGKTTTVQYSKKKMKLSEHNVITLMENDNYSY